MMTHEQTLQMLKGFISPLERVISEQGKAIVLLERKYRSLELRMASIEQKEEDRQAKELKEEEELNEITERAAQGDIYSHHENENGRC